MISSKTKPPSTSSPNAKRIWPRDQIQDARKVELPPLLERRGYRLRELPRDNYQVEDHDDLVIKHHYWTWPSRHLKGNAIDFLMFIECRTFDEAMEILTDDDPDPS